MRVMLGALALSALLPVLVTASLAATCAALPAAFDYAGYDEEVRLEVAELASLQEQTAVLAGRFHDGGNTVHPALAVSRDGGRSWTFVPVLYSGAGLSRLQTHGTATIWGIVSFRQEGTDEAQFLLRSRDAGASWCALPLDGLDTLRSVETLRFYDDRHGLLVFSEFPFGSRRMVYQTADGGDTWVPLWRTDADRTTVPGSGFAYPGAAVPPPHAPLWDLDMGAYRIAGLLRVRMQDAWHMVEYYGYYNSPLWAERSRLARVYRLEGGRLRPAP